MLNIDFTFLFTAINLIVLYLFLNKFLFKRVGKFMEERSKAIESDIQKAAELKSDGEAYLARQQTLLESAKDEREKIIGDASYKASKQYDSVIADAKSEASRIIAAARDEIERERENMQGQLRDEIASLALAAASKVVEANMDSERNRELVDEFLDKEGVA